MNLSFPPIGKNASVTALSDEFTLLLVGSIARQAASPTAILSHEPGREESMTQLGRGAFNQAVADALKRWKETSSGSAET